MSLELKQMDTEPSLKDVLEAFKRQMMFDICVHHIATIQSFDSVKKTCVAKINYDKTIYTNSSNSSRTKKPLPYPILQDVPVINLRGGKCGLSMPIKVGDQCLIFFNDRDIDNWFNGARSGEVASLRLHSMSDGFALVGLSDLRDSYYYDPNRPSLYNEHARVSVDTSKVLISNDNDTLNGLIQALTTELKDLVDQIKIIQVSGVTGGTTNSALPINAAAISAIGDRIGVTAGKLGELLL